MNAKREKSIIPPGVLTRTIKDLAGNVMSFSVERMGAGLSQVRLTLAFPDEEIEGLSKALNEAKAPPIPSSRGTIEPPPTGGSTLAADNKETLVQIKLAAAGLEDRIDQATRCGVDVDLEDAVREFAKCVKEA